MRKASPAVHIPDLSKTTVALAEVVPTVFADLDTSAVISRDGYIDHHNIFNAAKPTWQGHDTGRFIFGTVTPTVASDELTDMVVELWGIDAQAIPMMLGRSVLTAAGTLAPIVGVPIVGRVQYAIRIAELEWTDVNPGDGVGEVSFPVFAQGYYKDADDA